MSGRVGVFTVKAWETTSQSPDDEVYSAIGFAEQFYHESQVPTWELQHLLISWVSGMLWSYLSFSYLSSFLLGWEHLLCASVSWKGVTCILLNRSSVKRLPESQKILYISTFNSVWIAKDYGYLKLDWMLFALWVNHEPMGGYSFKVIQGVIKLTCDEPMIVYIDYQFDKNYNQIRSKSLGISVRDFLDWVSIGGRLNLGSWFHRSSTQSATQGESQLSTRFHYFLFPKAVRPAVAPSWW